MATDQFADDEVKQKCNELYRGWALAYKNVQGMQNIATLYKQLPQRKRAPNKETSKVLRETERDEDSEDESHATHRRGNSVTASNSASGSSTHRRHSSATAIPNAATPQAPYNTTKIYPGPEVSLKASKKDKKSKSSKKQQQPFSFNSELPQINRIITLASIESTGLLNALKLINREHERVSENQNARNRFETCKSLRRQTFRYCSLVMDESYLGTLLNANDQLSDALILYEQLDKSFDYDSDSEDYDDPDASSARAANQGASLGIRSPTSPGPGGIATGIAGLSLKGKQPGGERAPAMPPRPPALGITSPDGSSGHLDGHSEEEDEEDENDPFADRNEVSTPRIEADEPRW